MSRSYPKLSPAEFELMKLLWKLERATVAEVREAHRASHPNGELAYTTVMTLLGRLVDKEAARVEKDKQPFRYRPAVRRMTILRERLRDFVSTTFDDDAAALVAQLVETDALTVGALANLVAVLAQAGEAGSDGGR